MSGRTSQATSEDIIQWNYYERLGDVTTSNETLSVKENTEEEVEEEFRRDSIFIKVSPEDAFKSSFLKIPGCVPIDVHACFKRLYPHSEVEKESLLKFYLKLCRLESKADMPFNRLWNYYSETKELSSDITARNMHEVANYCIIDVSRCQELTVKCNIINNYRKVASIAYVSLFDTHYRANRIKVKNLLGIYATKRNMLFSTICHKDKEKARGITLAEQYNIGLVARFVIAKGFGIKYGDTDSLYLTCPDKYYEKCDSNYNENKLSKEAYWSEIVKITMKVMDEFRNKVNAYLRIKNGTSYLKMVYEEVLLPVCFTGIDTVKQGQTELFRFIGEKIMREVMNIDNTRTIYQIVENTLREASKKQWDFNQFVAMATWKPNKDNKCIQRFIERMKENYENKIPDSGKHFSYIVVKGERYRDKNGQLIPRRNADYMEFPDIAKEFNMKIDINYYLEKTVGLCARFINNDDKYQPLLHIRLCNSKIRMKKRSRLMFIPRTRQKIA
ncbi:hypothetical protein C2G38_2033211 [Gigaspora rosea]|uniref:DNA-directed DNA polymerase n=1 Tax=Gigaspora rosea TaxID=44941 RepID=A0A397VM49_9GLOM|nr:hypothetical protein C2G38_2033211 [Gigaspora rosea]